MEVGVALAVFVGIVNIGQHLTVSVTSSSIPTLPTRASERAFAEVFAHGFRLDSSKLMGLATLVVGNRVQF